MLNTDLNGPYAITANSGPVSTDQGHVVVFRPFTFFIEQVGDDTYWIYSGPSDTIHATADYRLVIQHGNQDWIIKPYDDQANTFTIVAANDTSLAWTDGGGPPGPNHQCVRP
ncbi:hypothetical protein V8B97DRAFT_1914950 [Scleroderma yunnanense]